MRINSKLLENCQIQVITPPVNGDSGVITGPYFSFKNYRRALVLILGADGTAGNGDIAVAFNQAKTVGGGSTKVLNALETGRIYTKDHATDVTGVAAWVKRTQATPDEQFTDTDSAEQENLWGFELSADDLDVDNNFDCFSVDIDADGGATKLIAALVIFYDAVYPDAPENMPTVVTD